MGKADKKLRKKNRKIYGITNFENYIKIFKNKTVNVYRYLKHYFNSLTMSLCIENSCINNC